MIGPRHLGDRSAALVDGTLDAADRDAALAHLRECPRCQLDVYAQSRTKARLSRLHGGPGLPDDVRSRLLSAGADPDCGLVPDYDDDLDDALLGAGPMVALSFAGPGPSRPSAPRGRTDDDDDASGARHLLGLPRVALRGGVRVIVGVGTGVATVAVGGTLVVLWATGSSPAAPGGPPVAPANQQVIQQRFDAPSPGPSASRREQDVALQQVLATVPSPGSVPDP